MFDTSPGHLAEIMGRVAIVYVALLVMMRVSGRRTMSDVTPMDIMLLLLVSETVSPSLTAGDESLTAVRRYRAFVEADGEITVVKKPGADT